ncbi:MAG: alanine--tRNA ligase, partial [Deltaproteobacteria bacterium]|nr:alanine--tRNA ligase [Deltaproteobacteria bacterium]
RIDRLIKEQREKDKEIASFKAKLVTKQSGDLLDGVRDIGGIKTLSKEVDAPTPKDLREFADRIRDRLESGIIVLGAKNNGKVMLICMVTKNLVDRFKAGQIISRLSSIVGGKGGGRPDMAQGGGNKPEKLAEALEMVSDIIRGD